MPQRDGRVIGDFAYFSPMQVICTDVDACVVSGSSEYLAEMDPDGASRVTVKKTRFGEILRGLESSSCINELSLRLSRS
jgi:hypothetical protein